MVLLVGPSDRVSRLAIAASQLTTVQDEHPVSEPGGIKPRLCRRDIASTSLTVHREYLVSYLGIDVVSGL